MHTVRNLAIRRLATSAVMLLILLGSPVATASAVPPAVVTPAADGWRWPLPEPHRVIAPFIAPVTPYAAGHRGIDLTAQTGDTVLAPHDGVVSFAGVVVDRPVLSLTQAGDLITTVEPVLALVAEGDRVQAGQQIGTVATGGHCPPGCLHLGIRLHGNYVSPLLYLGGLQRAVLLPAGP
ncbi:murein hydrolase activator EnvC [Cryobacterium sp. TMS1-13-1]|uniref:murein hydrolase activator EnvC family protein n=1 Tax=Cryobacterium sp. TMS1-13-1 TaxID=1259220 RepID=UPI00106A2D14|nr:M23 family metallopeptidase [Cryobacterium sp. TMS1-13-1]TFD19104.1 M23 family metallopeptidase [Cryobacterium sp. TMS1-13-1]